MKILKVSKHKQPSHRRTSKEVATRIYFSFKGETVIDDLERRHSRPYNELKKFVPEILNSPELELNPSDTARVKASWSQKAGCSMCPCSPGFILRSKEGHTLYPFEGWDIYVTIGE